MTANLFLTKEVILYNKKMLDSFNKWLGYELIKRTNLDETDSKTLFESPFVVMSHGTETDPVFKYGNKKTLDLMEISWDEFIKMHSKYTAEPVLQEERQKLLDEVTRNGFIRNYNGIRISKTGKRFKVSNAIVWNVLDEHENYCGQAATFNQWEYL